MRKLMNWMLAAILICGANMMISCSSNDLPVEPKPQLPDQASMFVQNVLSDARYTRDIFQVSNMDGSVESAPIIRLNVNSYEEALEELLKLLPEGVAETAFPDDHYQRLFSEATGYRLNAPAADGGESIIIINKTQDLFCSMLGYAWIDLSSDLQEALQVQMIVYFANTGEDDLTNFISCLMNVIQYCQPDANDPTALICNIPTREMYVDLVIPFVTTKMMMALVPTEEGDGKCAMTDSQGKVYGYLYVMGPEHSGDAQNVYVLDEALQASMAAQIGMAFSKISFYLADTL